MMSIHRFRSVLSALMLGVCCAASAQSLDARLERQYAEKNWPAALALIEADLVTKPGDVGMQIQRGVVLSNLNRTADALAAFRKVAAEHPDMPGPLNNIAVLLAAQGDLNGAKESLERAIRTNPIYATTYENLGDLYSHMAAEAYRKALRMDKGTDPARPKLQMLGLQQADSALRGGATKTAASGGGSPPVLPGVEGSAKELPSGALTTKVATTTPAVTPKPTAATPSASVPTRSASAPVLAALPAKPASALSPAATPAVATAPLAASRPSAPASAAVVAKATAPSVPAVPASAVTAGLKPPTAAIQPIASAEERELSKAVKAWAKAWADRDMADYFAAYTADFKGKSASRSAWESERRERILGKSKISVTVDKLRFKINANRADVQMEQTYLAGELRASTRKTLSFVKVGKRWLISQEVAGK